MPAPLLLSLHTTLMAVPGWGLITPFHTVHILHRDLTPADKLAVRIVDARRFFIAGEHSCEGCTNVLECSRESKIILKTSHSEHEFKSNSDGSDQILMDVNILEFKSFGGLSLLPSQG
ncbi:hypothetical protein C8R44DRAFT_754338 [Mycena epipterygia]|nr:hypothetical protein C8R44DRAFT_754338 [Mycena epipterygia]